MSRPLLLGHRGARAIKSIPENTLASFDRALADGCDGFEFDVRLTADGEAVVCHNPKTHGIEIASALARQIQTLPRLHEVLHRYRESFLDIELKVAGLERIVLEALKRYQAQRFVVSSFLTAVLEVIHTADSTIPLGLICETKAQLRRWSQIPVQYVIPHNVLASRDLIGDLQASGRKVLVWTVNRPAEMRRFAEWGVNGIISDNPEKLRATLG